MNKDSWGPNPRRRTPNSIDIFRWAGFLKEQLQKVWSVPRGPYYLSISLLALLIGIFVLIDVSTTSGKIHSGVSLAGFDVGGLTEKEAISAIKKRIKTNINKSIEVEYGSESARLVPAQLDFSINYQQSVKKAFSYGREGNFFSKASERFLSWFRAADLEPDYKLSDNYLNDFLHDLGGKKHKPAVNAAIRIINNKPKLIKSKPGFGINSKRAGLAIISAILNPPKVILNAEKLFPEVTEEDAQEALADSRLIISSPVILTAGTKKWTVSKEKLISLFEAQVSEKKLKASLDKNKTVDYIESFTSVLNKKPRDAKFAVYGVKASVIPSSDGVDVNENATYHNLIKAALRIKKRHAVVSVKKIKPQRTTAEAQKMGVKEMVSSFTTYYPAGKPRVKNIHRLAEILDGMLIAPSETFSFNGRIGERTVERGFVPAPEIRNGEFVETVGGGICQVSTTVFNAILLGGYPVGERSPHSLFIKKYPPGRDAAVSYPKPDLTFTNDTKSWILVKGAYTATSITISFYSTDYNRDVSFITNFLGTIPFPTKEEKDPTLEKGKRKEVKKGIQGRRYHVIRIVTQNGKEIRRTNIHSTFKPTPRVVKVGTKPTEEDKKKKEAETKQEGD